MEAVCIVVAVVVVAAEAWLPTTKAGKALWYPAALEEEEASVIFWNDPPVVHWMGHLQSAADVVVVVFAAVDSASCRMTIAALEEMVPFDT